jgi:hypothetical protein
MRITDSWSEPEDPEEEAEDCTTNNHLMCDHVSDEVLFFLKRLVLKMRDKEVFGDARWLSAYVFPEGCRIEADIN